MYNMTLQNHEINIFCKKLFKLYCWKWKNQARHLLVRLNQIGNSNFIICPRETYLHHQNSLYLFIEKNIILKFCVILECMKHSNNNRQALTLPNYVNNGTSAKVTSSAGIF